MSNQEPATILLIDDHPMLRTGVKQLISMAPGYHRCRRSQQRRTGY